MNRLLKTAAVFVSAMLLSPASAFAYESQITPVGLHLAVSATGLVVATLLLLEALRLRRIALGGAVATNLYYVVLAVVVLAASALAKWAGNFVGGVTLEQTELISELLVLLGMALLAGYFYSVRTAMQAYLKVMRSEQDLQKASDAEKPGAEPLG